MNSRMIWTIAAGAGLLGVLALGLAMRGVSSPTTKDELLSVPPGDLVTPPPEAPVKEPPAPAKPRKAPLAPTAIQELQSTESGLKYAVLTEGTGEPVTPGQTVLLEYTGWLADGKKFDSSLDRSGPLDVVVGDGSIMAGWNEGLSMMKVGEKRQLVIPPELAYGSNGRPPLIPPDATLTFEMELVGVK